MPDINALRSEYKRLAKRADQRLVRLEQGGLTGGSAYRSASQMTGSDNPRFNRGIATDARRLRGQINKVRRFLGMETSTKTGIAKIESGRSKTLKNEYGIEADGEQIKAIFEGALYKKLNDRFGSKTAATIIGSIQKTEGQVKQTLQELADQHVYLSRSDKLSISATIGNYMRSNKLEYLF